MLNKSKKDIPTKNYIILSIIVLFSVFLTFYFFDWYKTYRDYQLTIPILREVVPEITEKELDHYVLDNERVILYICNPLSSDCRNLDERMKKLIEKQSLQNFIVYLNLNSVTDFQSFYNTFNEGYPFGIKLDKYPALCHFENGELKTLLKGNKNESLTIKQIENFLNTHGIGEE